MSDGFADLVLSNSEIPAAYTHRFRQKTEIEVGTGEKATYPSDMTGNTQRSWVWPEPLRAAVSISYDGTLASHALVAAPMLERYGFKATFYTEPAHALDNIQEWRRLSKVGHEIGNGALVEAAGESGHLPRWTPEMIGDEVESVRNFIEEHFPGHQDHSFAFPCGSPICAGGRDYREVIEAQGYIARSGVEGYNAPASCHLGYLRCVPVRGMGAEELVTIAEIAMRSGEWTIFTFEGIGEGRFPVDPRTHEALLRFLWERREQLMVGTVMAIARHVNTVRAGRFQWA